MSTTDSPALTLQDRLKGYGQLLLSLTHSPGLAVVNLLLLAATLTLVLTSDRSVLTGVLIIAWGAGACSLAHYVGTHPRPYLDGKRIALAYLAITVVLYVLLNGLYRLLGM